MNDSSFILFTRTYDLIKWLLPASARFPRNQRHIVTDRLQAALLDFQETIFEANACQGKRRLAHLERADAHLNKVRLYLRLVHEWGWLTVGQYEHVSRLVSEVGKLLGGWMRQTRA